MTDKELDKLKNSIELLECKNNCFRFNSLAEDMKVSGIILICKILFAILKEIRK